MASWLSWDPTPTWTGGPPTVSSEVCQYVVVNGAVHFTIELTISDGGGATDVTIAGPMFPFEWDGDIPVAGYVTVAGTATDPELYYDMSDNTVTNRIIEAHGMPTFTDDAACVVVISGILPHAPWTTFTADEAWTTATPGSITEVVGSKVIGDSVLLYFANWQSADSNACANITWVPTMTPPDQDTYGAVSVLEKAGAGGATWSNPLGYHDLAHATASNRYVSCKSFTTATDGQAVEVSMIGWAPLGPWQKFTPSWTWTTADPGSITTQGIYTVQNGMCYFHAYMTSADGNGATAAVMALPVVPLHSSAKIACPSYQLQNATHSDPKGYIDAGQQASADRTVKFVNFSTATDGETVTLYVSGWFPVDE